ncbi:MAG: SDR family NAD(P)-dependent oxidoreductase [Sciscionella sp.]
MNSSGRSALAGRRVLITGAARGIGAALAIRLHQRGARVALMGLEPELLEGVAAGIGSAPWRCCDVADHVAVEEAVAALVAELDGLDVVVANAGIAKQLPLIGGRPDVLAQTLRVNVMGTYHTLRATGPHISHSQGYALPIASLGAAINLPLMGAYSASKAAVEVLGNTLRTELRHTGARVGVGYFAELDTDMTSRGFGTRAAAKLTGGGSYSRLTPLSAGIDALERGIARRSRRVVAPWWVAPLLPVRMAAQRVIEIALPGGLEEALRIAREEDIPFTTAQPEMRGDSQL